MVLLALFLGTCSLDTTSLDSMSYKQKLMYYYKQYDYWVQDKDGVTVFFDEKDMYGCHNKRVKIVKR